MSEPVPPLPSDPPKQEAGRARRLALAFQGVFGQQGRRSSDQRLVLEHLRAACGRDKPIFQLDKVGNFDALRAAHVDGAQTQYLIIKRQLGLARKLSNEDKPKKAKVKR